LDLVKQHLDIGLYTNNREEMLEFWQQDVGLEFDHIGKLGGGVHQVRHFLGRGEASGPMGPILKINHDRDALGESCPSGYRELIIAREGISEPRSMTDPDGNRLQLVAPGTFGIKTTGVRMSVRDVASFHDFHGRVLGLPPATDAGPNAYRYGETVVIFEADPSANPSSVKRAKGFRYITAQIRKADLEYETILSKGGAAEWNP
jgi:lactoylglutathione lyase